MINFKEIDWVSIGSKIYDIATRQSNYSIKIQGTSKRILRIDWTHNNIFDHTLLVGYLHGTVDISGTEATVIHQKMYLGSNLIIVPSEIETIKHFYLNHYSKFYGTFTVNVFEPTIPVVTDLIATQLNNLEVELELINNNLVNLPGATVLQLGSTVANQVELSLAQQEQSLITQITTLLGSVI